MQQETKNRLEENYSTIYITIVSVLLGLALDDIVSILRNIESISFFNWLTAAFSVHVIFNAWVGYSAVASIARLVPSVWDALNVFTLSVAHFALNSAIGEEPTVFFYTASCYSAVAGGVTYYNVWRANQDDSITLRPATFFKIIGINAAGALAFLIAGVLTQTTILSTTVQNYVVVLGIPFATLWLFVFLRVWRANGLPVWRQSRISIEKT